MAPPPPGTDWLDAARGGHLGLRVTQTMGTGPRGGGCCCQATGRAPAGRPQLRRVLHVRHWQANGEESASDDGAQWWEAGAGGYLCFVGFLVPFLMQGAK